MLYFDWAATSLIDKDIIDNVRIQMGTDYGNASSLHSMGQKAFNFLEGARTNIAKEFHVNNKQIYFTSGGTESNNIVLLSYLLNEKRGTGASIVIGATEHPGLVHSAKLLGKAGFNVRIANANANGIVTAQAVEKKLDKDTLLVCVMAVNNETGAINPVTEIANMLAKFYEGKRKPHFHVDAVQALGKIVFDINKWQVDSVSMSAHKIAGPVGAGLLYLKQPIVSIFTAAGQEGGIRGGTQNVFAALCMDKLINKYHINVGKASLIRYEEQKQMTKDFINGLLNIKGRNSNMSLVKILPRCREKIADNISDIAYSPWIVQASFSNIPGRVMLRALNEKGICISTGSACSSGSKNRPVLEAMGVTKQDATNAVRFSFFTPITKENIQKLLQILGEVCLDFN